MDTRMEAIIGKDDFWEPNYISRLEPAERNIYVIGNGKVRGVIAGDDNTGSGIQIGIHDCALQCRGNIFRSDYALIDMQWSRILVRVEGNLFWVPAAAVAYPEVSGFTINYTIIGKHIHCESLLYPVEEYVIHDQYKLSLDFFCAPDSPVLYCVTSVVNCGMKPVFIEVIHTFAPTGLVTNRRITKRENILRVTALGNWTRLAITSPSGTVAQLPAIRLSSSSRPLKSVSYPRFMITHKAAECRVNQEISLTSVILIGTQQQKNVRESASVLKENRRCYKKLLQDTVHFHCGHERINDVYCHAFQLLRAFCRDNGQMNAAVFDGYDGCWIRDSIMAQLGLCLSGQMDEAKKIVLYLLDNVPPKQGQYEEYGMLAYGIWMYLCISQDTDVIRKIWTTLFTFIEEPFESDWYNRKYNLCLSVTEGYSERFWLGMGYSLSQHCWLIIGLTCMAAIAEHFNLPVPEGRIGLWKQIAASIRKRIFGSEKGSMIHDNHFVKRLNPDLTVQWKAPVKRFISDPRHHRRHYGIPGHYHIEDGTFMDLMPDIQLCIPYLMELYDPADCVSIATSDWIYNVLWNQFWDFGGIGRYNGLSDCDQETSGPWFYAGIMFSRALVLQENYDRMNEIINWTLNEGVKGYTWPERISQTHPRNDDDRYFHSVMTWTYGEWILLLLREILGLRYSLNGLSVCPHVPPGWEDIHTENICFYDKRFSIDIKGWGSEIESATLNDKTTNLHELTEGGHIVITMTNKTG
jgi:hypothetical protein